MPIIPITRPMIRAAASPPSNADTESKRDRKRTSRNTPWKFINLQLAMFDDSWSLRASDAGTRRTWRHRYPTAGKESAVLNEFISPHDLGRGIGLAVDFMGDYDDFLSFFRSKGRKTWFFQLGGKATSFPGSRLLVALAWWWGCADLKMAARLEILDPEQFDNFWRFVSPLSVRGAWMSDTHVVSEKMPQS